MSNHQLESRMREIRPSGSEGGGTGLTGPPYPYREAGWRQVAPSSMLTQVVFTNAAQGGWTRSRLNPRGLCF